MWHRSVTLVGIAETCKRKSQTPAQPVRRTETPRRGGRKRTWPSTGASKAAGLWGGYTAAGRGFAPFLESIIENWGKKDRPLISKISLQIADFFPDSESVIFDKFSQFLPECC